MKGRIMPISFATLGLSTALAFGPGISMPPAAANDSLPSTAAVKQKAERATPMMSIGQAIAIAEERGLTDIREIERERRGYEMEARNAEGRPVELFIDGWTGEIVEWEYDD